MTTAPSPTLPQQFVEGLRSQLVAPESVPAIDEGLRAWSDWWLGLSTKPELQIALAQSAVAAGIDTWRYAVAAAQAASGSAEAASDGETPFAGNGWNLWPFNVYARAHAHLKKWSSQALGAVNDLSPASTLRLELLRRWVLDAASPAHYLLTNPELLAQTAAEGGQNLLRGVQYWLEDVAQMLEGRGAHGTENFRVGAKVAVTPGKVVMRNSLIELIQYSPQSASVHAEPVLITPAWIMKYYVLDLSPQNSLVKFLLERGHTVFMISWRNPTGADRELAMSDYVELGFRAALDAVSAIVPRQRVHTVGYCIGGTLLSIAAAALAREGDERIASITLLAAQTDFSEPGELSVFISPNQLSALEVQMQRDGVLHSQSMSAAFALLRSSDLIWAPAINQYLRGQRGSMNDLMAWNADGTRMPCRMHSEYLTRLYLHNELSTGHYTVDGPNIDLKQLTVPMFVVGTETDHVAPWQSVFKTHALTRSGDYTFLLTSGGHNAGIVSGAVNPKRRHRLLRWQGSTDSGPTAFFHDAELRAGSWWSSWQQWLADRSTPAKVAPPPLGNAAAGYPAIADAPGEYVRG
jgi:polyhydroxyalkanoate synthase subunit PhaC